jgi:redox-sensitive bicupin YhaK (pirin superfamily)
VIELTDGRDEVVGDLRVRRVLPARGRRTVGAWCFADHMGPALLTPEHGLDVGPHPHIGLHTVTWLLEGSARHRDGLGSDQVIRPGQLNLMTAGRGIAHAEEPDGRTGGTLHGIQLWLAQPDSTRLGPPAFEHHAELPRAIYGATEVTVILGEVEGLVSPARHDTPTVGLELAVRGPTTLPLDPTFEHALVVLAGAVAIDDTIATPGRLAFLPPGVDELTLTSREPARGVLLGGAPFAERLFMWWNFVARTQDEADEARRSWLDDDGRFAPVASSLSPMAVPEPWWH